MKNKLLILFVCIAKGRYRDLGERYILLLPDGFSSSHTVGANNIITHDADYFWQKPTVMRSK